MKDINFCGYPVPNKSAPTHFLLVGKTGSGKTNILTMLMRSALLNVQAEPDYRAVVYDQKQDMVGIIKAQGITDPQLRILNPYDKRCYEWDMAKDVTGQDTAFQIASIFIPEEDSQNRYFTDAARALLAGVMNVFIEKGIERRKNSRGRLKPDWRLADLIYTMRNGKRIRHVLEQTTEGQELIQLHLENEKTTTSILSTVDTRLTPLMVPAALWRKAGDSGKKLSLETFLGGKYVLVLGNNQQARRPLQALNRILFQRLTELTLDLPDTDEEGSSPRRVWFFLDEARKIGQLDGLDDLMTNGRSKGAAVVLAFQDIDGMRHVYKKEVAQEITGMCGHYCFLKMSGTETPRWASEVIGEMEEAVQLGKQGTSTGGGDARQDTGTSDHIHKSSSILPSQLTRLPYPSRTSGTRFYANIPSVSNNILNCTDNQRLLPDEMDRAKGPEADPKQNIHKWKEIGDYYFKQLPELGEKDCERLGIPMFPKAPDPNKMVPDTNDPEKRAGRQADEKRDFRRSAPSTAVPLLEETTTYNGL